MDDPDHHPNLTRLLLEDVCSDLVRFRHSGGDPSRFEAVRIDREYALGTPGAFADLRVEPEGEPPYFLEVKYGYKAQTVVDHMLRKYSAPGSPGSGATRLVLVVEAGAHADWPAAEARLRAALPPQLSLEIWDEARLQSLMAECWGRNFPSFASKNLLPVREAIDRSKERLAFGNKLGSSYAERALRQNLLWHFGVWRLRELRHGRSGAGIASILPPGAYPHVVVLSADLSGFSGYVRDTPDDAIVRQSLTSFYSRARYQVINAGGMLAQFMGDQIVALFGIPDGRRGYVEAAAQTSLRLLDIGASVSYDWQRKIDHVQPFIGVHAGMAMGRVQLVPMRALDHSRQAVIGGCVNMASQLLNMAGPGEIVVSNVLRHALRNSSYEFAEREFVEADTAGLIHPWQLVPPLNDPGR